MDIHERAVLISNYTTRSVEFIENEINEAIKEHLESRRCENCKWLKQKSGNWECKEAQTGYNTACGILNILDPANHYCSMYEVKK